MKRALAIALLVSACDVGPDPAEIERVRKGTEMVRQQLKMPQSALFKDVKVKGDVVCGEVNASVGLGRTGYERFIAKDGTVTLSSQLPTTSAMDALWATNCK